MCNGLLSHFLCSKNSFFQMAALNLVCSLLLMMQCLPLNPFSWLIEDYSSKCFTPAELRKPRKKCKKDIAKTVFDWSHFQVRSFFSLVQKLSTNFIANAMGLLQRLNLQFLLWSTYFCYSVRVITDRSWNAHTFGFLFKGLNENFYQSSLKPILK